MLAASCLTGEAGGGSVGVAILARPWLGLHSPVEVVQGRALAALVHLPGSPPATVISIYGHTGNSLGEKNVSLLAAVGEHASSRAPFIVGGDLNMHPALLTDEGVDHRLRA